MEARRDEDTPFSARSGGMVRSAHGVRPSGRQDAVEHGRANSRFCASASFVSCPQPVSDKRLVSALRGPSQRTLAVDERRFMADSVRRPMAASWYSSSKNPDLAD
jgi:hypothetical protein